MNHTASTIYIEEDNFYLEVYLDPFNKRIRIDDYRGNTNLVLEKAEELASKHQAEKLIIKSRIEDTLPLYERGLQPEAVVDRYFLGSDAHFFSKFYTVERKKNDHWITEDGMIHSIYQLDKATDKPYPPKEYELKKADEDCAEELAGCIVRFFKFTLHPYMILNM